MVAKFKAKSAGEIFSVTLARDRTTPFVRHIRLLGLVLIGNSHS